MKRSIITLSLLLCLLPWSFASANDSARIKATLVLASDEGGRIDPSLRPFQRQLRRFGSSFEKLGEGSTVGSSGDNKTIRLAGNNQVELKVISITHAASKGKQTQEVSLEAKWTEGRKTVYRIRGNLPLALAAPPDANGTRVLIIYGD
jgi:hypothetical protein